MNNRFAILASALSADARQATTAARVAGFAGLMFDAYATGLSLPDLSQSGRREFRHVLSAQDRQLVGLRVDCGNKGFSIGADVDRTMRHVDRAMECAAGLGEPLLCVDLGPLPEVPRPIQPKPRVTPDMAGLILLPNLPDPEPPQSLHEPIPVDPRFVAQVDSVLVELGRLADRYACVVAFSSELSTLSALDRALRAAGCPWFGIDLDPVAMLRDTMKTDEVFSTFAPHVRHVRARDAVSGTDFRTRPTVIGAGDTNWPELLTLLNDAGYNGWLTLDPTSLVDRAGGARAGLTHLKSKKHA